MKQLTRYILGAVLLSATLTPHVIAQVQVRVQVDRSRPIYAGSRFAYRIVIENGQLQGNIDLSPLKVYHPSGPSVQNSTSIINGRTSSSQNLTYQLIAPEKGQYTIPSVNVIVDGNTYPTDPVTISVVEPGSTKQIDIEAQLSTQTCYVGQPVILTVSFYIWTDIVRARQIGNINIQVPILEDPGFYQEDIDAFPANTTQTVLSINGQEEGVFQDQLLHESVNCVRVRLIKVLIPKKSGTIDIKPAAVTADLAVAQKRQNRDSFFGDFLGPQYEYQRFGAQSKALQLTVQDLPQAGKPSDFYGLVGNYTITAAATPKDVNVGDPITLAIRIGGSQYLKAVKWPDLEAIPEMAESFKIPSERSEGEIQNGAKIFTQTIRPNHDGVTEIPAIPLSFFDDETGRYRTVQSKPISLKVSPTRIVTGVDVESHQFSSARKQVQAISEGLSANYTSSDALVNQRFSPLTAITSPAFIGLYAIPLAALVVSLVSRYALADTPQRQAAGKRRKAYSLAVKQLHHAADHDIPSQQVLAALKQYVADKFGKSAGALTPQDCRNVILETTGDAALADRYQAVMEQTEASEYSPMAFQLTDEKQNEILELLAVIEKKVK